MQGRKEKVIEFQTEGKPKQKHKEKIFCINIHRWFKYLIQE